MSLLQLYLQQMLLFLFSLLLLKGATRAEEQACRIPTVELANGVEMPRLMLGTAHFILPEEGAGIADSSSASDSISSVEFSGFLPENTYRSVQMALESGWRGIDSAVIYLSHRQIGHVLGNWFAEGKLTRSDIFLATKVFHGRVDIAMGDTVMDIDTMTVTEIAEATRRQLDQAFRDVGVGYFDLVLMHWPAVMYSQAPDNREKRIACWKVLESYYGRGLVRAIGVSNFSEIHLEQLQEDGATILPMVNQVEASVYLQYERIWKYCQEHSIVMQAYSPLGRTAQKMLQDELLLELAQKYDVNQGQVAMRYLLQKEYSIVNLSSSRKRLETNPDIFSFELDVDDMSRLGQLNRSDGSWGLPSPYDMS